MSVIHSQVPKVSQTKERCPCCGHITEQTVEHDGGRLFTHWCHRCLIPRTKIHQPGDVEGDHA